MIRLESTEVLQNGKPGGAGFFWKKLHTENVVPLDGRGERSAVIARCHRRGDHWRTIRVREVHENWRLDSAQHPRVSANFNLVPADVRRLNARRETRTLAGEQAGTRGIRSFRAALKQPLHSYANPQEWLAPRNGLQHRCTQASIEEFTTGKMAYSGNDDFRRRGDHCRIRSYLCGRAKMLECLLDGTDVTGAVINDGDHRSPLVLGSILASRRSREQATRRARAKALKSASIL